MLIQMTLSIIQKGYNNQALMLIIITYQNHMIGQTEITEPNSHLSENTVPNNSQPNQSGSDHHLKQEKAIELQDPQSTQCVPEKQYIDIPKKNIQNRNNMVDESGMTQEDTISNLKQLGTHQQGEMKRDKILKSKSQFDDQALQINLQSMCQIHPNIKNKQELLQLINKARVLIEGLIKLIENHITIQVYFKKSKTTKQQIIDSYRQIENAIVLMKEACEQNKANFSIVSEIIYFIVTILDKMQIDKLPAIDKAIWLLEFQTKVHYSLDFIINSIDAKDDITTLPMQKNPKFWSAVKFQTICHKPQKLQEKFKYLKKILGITTTAVIKQQKSDWAVSKIVSFGMTYPASMINDKESQLIAMRFYRNPEVNLAKKIWNLPENGMIKQVAKLGLKNVKNNIKIYIPLDEEAIPDNIMKDNGKSIQVRLLSNDDLFLKKQKKQTSSSFFATLCTSPSDQNDFNEITQVILHMHGGGFIALSSRSMQTYTRRWTRKLNIPVFSVDYRMPPDHPFPSAPEDCFKVYKFLINHINKYFNISPKKIILAGDSAGGNLALSTTALIMKNNLPIPYGIYAAYPACDLQKRFSPSKIHAFTDPLLYPSMLLLCLRQYIGFDSEQQYNPLASPIFITEQFVGGEIGDRKFPKKWPKTVLHVGAKDPLYDDSLKIAEKLMEQNIPYSLHVYNDLSHGFLNLDFIVEDCKKTVDDSIEHLRKLLQ